MAVCTLFDTHVAVAHITSPSKTNTPQSQRKKDSIMTDNMTPEERARALLASQPARLTEITLTHDGPHGIEWCACPWPDEAGRLHITYILKGNRTLTAYMEPGGKRIRITTSKSHQLHHLINEIRNIVGHKLTSKSANDKLKQMERFFVEMLENISSGQ